MLVVFLLQNALATLSSTVTGHIANDSVHVTVVKYIHMLVVNALHRL